MMPGSSFDSVLKIDPNGVVEPQGPLAFNKDETLVQIFALVVQQSYDGPDAFCIGEKEFGDVVGADGRWTIKPQQRFGLFRPGSADAIAVTLSRTASNEFPRVNWSIEKVRLDGSGSEVEQATPLMEPTARRPPDPKNAGPESQPTQDQVKVEVVLSADELREIGEHTALHHDALSSYMRAALGNQVFIHDVYAKQGEFLQKLPNEKYRRVTFL